MLISCNKLKTHIKNSEDIDFHKIWDLFTIRCAEVESVNEVGNSFDGVVIAEIKECKDHPDSDHLHILKVDAGEKELIDVVCGAPNVRVGLKTAFIKVGGHIEDIEITKRPLRGVISNGMCCSMRELSIGDNHDGIIELPSDAPVGMDIKEYLPIKDIIVEIDNKSLTNRPDLWGHFGIAREIAAITNHELLELPKEDIKNDKKDLDIVIDNPDLCYRYTGLTIDNIKNNKTPLDMQIFLYYVGMRSISLIVDLTNYLMLELGQPMHAFDERIVKNILVTNANESDKFITLDGEERTLSKDMLMIKNGSEYAAIAGVMGGMDSEIMNDTDKIFLESACFNAGSVRKTAVSLGLRTESSARYEKSLDPNMTDEAIKRFVYLLRQVNKDLVISSNLTDVYPTKLESITLNLKKDLVKKYLGTTIDDEEIKSILERLEFKVKINNDNYEVLVPTFRHSKDINIEEDLIEEIARIYGLENIKSEPLKLDLISHEYDLVFNQEYEAKYMLANKFNLNEVHSYIWYDTLILKELGINKDGVKIISKNEKNILRDDLSLSLMSIVRDNFKNYSKVNIFEIATIIKDNENKRVLSIILGDDEKNIELLYNNAKNICKYLFKVLKNKDITFNDDIVSFDYYDEKYNKTIVIDNDSIGTLNILKNKYSNKLCKKKSIVCIDIDFDKYTTINNSDIKVPQISKYPVVDLDYTIILNDNQKYRDLLSVLNKYNNDLIKSMKLLDIYENKYSIRYTIGSNERTLDQNDLKDFKDNFIKFIKDNNFTIIE